MPNKNKKAFFLYWKNKFYRISYGLFKRFYFNDFFEYIVRFSWRVNVVKGTNVRKF